MATISNSAVSSIRAAPTCLEQERFWAPGGAGRQALSAIRRGWQAYIRFKRLTILSEKALAARNLKRQDLGRHAFFDAQD